MTCDETRRRFRASALLSVLALGLRRCGAEDGEAGKGGIKTDAGVTSEPCPGSANKERGCIYLGTLSDLTEGPFAPLAVPITDAQKEFWKRVNDYGGIAGKYDVDVEKYTRDNKYNPEEHVAKLREIEPNVLALAQSLGTPPTLAGPRAPEAGRGRGRSRELVVGLVVRGRGPDPRERLQLLHRVDERARLGGRGVRQAGQGAGRGLPRRLRRRLRRRA